MVARSATSHRTSRAALLFATALAALTIVAPVPALAETNPNGSRGQNKLVHAGMPTQDQRAVTLHRRLLEVSTTYEQARQRVSLLTEHSKILASQAEQAETRAEQLHRLVTDQPAGGVVSGFSTLFGGTSDLDRATAAVAAQQHAAQLATTAHQGLARARAEAEDARRVWTTVENRAERIQVEIAAMTAAVTASKQSEFGSAYSVDNPAQDRRNRKALARWQAYLASLAEAGVVPPTAKTLENPRALTGQLDAMYDRRGRLIPGIATVDRTGAEPLTVLPAQTIRAVSAAFSRIGLPGAADVVGPDAYACGGLAHESWSTTTVRLPPNSLAQWERLQTVPRAQIQVGDLVYLGDDVVGIHRAGVYLGSGLMIAADTADGEVAVTALPTNDLYGTKRATLPSTGLSTAPTPSGISIGCGEVASAKTTTDREGAWTFPLAEDSYSMSAGFGDSGWLWSSGEHSGQDFAAPVGTPVYAARAGVVAVENQDWAGKLIRVDHGVGLETWYAHMSQVAVRNGQRVDAGDVIGAVGNEGNSTGPHLHFEMRVDDVATDPMAVLRPEESLSGWVGYANGTIPQSALCAATVEGQLLRCDAAVAYRLMAQAFEKERGETLCITDSYRSREGQEQVFRTKPGLAAVPGTSNHGWGIAVDLCGGVEQFGTPEQNWVVANGPVFGWFHPHWAGADGTRPEPWHFEYGRG